MRPAGWITVLCGLVFFVSACGPKYTYPADSVPQKIEEIALKEYKLEVTAKVVGKTVGAFVYLDSIVDDAGQIPKDVYEAMGQVMQVVTRVCLSTDREVDFCTVILRDRVHSGELVITRSLDDTRRAHADMIGIEESINRTLFGQSSHAAEEAGEETYVLQDIHLENFLADQIVQRIRFNLLKESDEEEAQPLILVDGAFDERLGERDFHFSIIALKFVNARELMHSVFEVVNEVLKGYKFKSFTKIEIQDYMNRQKLVVDAQTLTDFQDGKITEEEIFERYLEESQSIQEAFKLFGFTLPSDTNGQGSAAAASPAP